jgi:ceramide glucosyltransferase
VAGIVAPDADEVNARRAAGGDFFTMTGWRLPLAAGFGVPVLNLFGTVLAWLAAGYGLIALLALWRFHRTGTNPAGALPTVSLLKPLCGAEPRLYENLRSFCMQDYPAPCQWVFGVRDPDDPAIAVVRRLQSEFPSLAIDLVVDGRLHGSNLKVSNLINIFERCRHDLLVLADSDIHVGPDYLSRVVAPLAAREVGVVTCLYRGRPTGSLWSRLGAQFIDDWFAPSVMVAQLFGSSDFAFGATLALRRETLAAIGGFQVIADQLADDWWLGELTRRRGLRTVLSDCVVTTDVTEDSAAALVAHELRWLRTIRSIQPLGYAFSFVTTGLPVALAGTLLAAGTAPAVAGLCVTAAARIVLNCAPRNRHGGVRLSGIGLIPIRDGLTFGLWIASFASRRVRWRRDDYSVGPDGAFRKVA